MGYNIFYAQFEVVYAICQKYKLWYNIMQICVPYFWGVQNNGLMLMLHSIKNTIIENI